MKIIIAALLIISAFLFTSCNKDDSPTGNNFDENLYANISYDTHYGSNGLEYIFKFFALEEDVLTAEGYQFRFDLNDDGSIEQDWSDSSSYKKIFDRPGKINVRLDVRSSNGQGVSCTAAVNVFINITPPHTLGQFQREPVWAKDGSNRLAFVWGDQLGGSGLHEIFLVTYPQGNVEQLTLELGDTALCKHFPEWAADGSKIYYTYNNAISYVDVSSKITNILIDSVFTCHSISCSKDGLYLYFCGNVNNINGLYRYTFANSKLEKISDFNQYPLTISPDGTKLAAGGSELSIFDLNQLQVIKTYYIIVQEDRIEWSPNGRYIALNYVDTSKSIRILDLEDESYDYIKVKGLNDIASWGYTWSPDGEILAFVGTHPEKTHTSIWGIKPDLN